MDSFQVIASESFVPFCFLIYKFGWGAFTSVVHSAHWCRGVLKVKKNFQKSLQWLVPSSVKVDNLRPVLAVSLIPVRGGPPLTRVSVRSPLQRFKLILTSFRQIDSSNRISELVCIVDTDIEAQYMMYRIILIFQYLMIHPWFLLKGS